MTMQKPRLSATQLGVLGAIAVARPVAGNDEGWVSCFSFFKRPAVRVLERLGMLEPKISGYIGPTDGQYHRITAAGRAALADGEHVDKTEDGQ